MASSRDRARVTHDPGTNRSDGAARGWAPANRRCSRVVRSIAVFAVAFACAAPAAASASNLEELVEKADSALRGKSSVGVFSMQVKKASFDRTFDAVVWDDCRNEQRTLVKLLGPAMWRAHGTLKVGDQLKSFDPRTNHVVVVNHSMLADSWMGSHFTNDDLMKETRLATHYSVQLVKTWQGENEARRPVTFHLFELTPKPTAPVAWGKILYELWEDGAVVLPTEAKYFRKVGDETPERVLRFGRLKKLGGREVPTEMVMRVTDKPGEFTRVAYSTLEFDVPIPNEKFTEQALRR